MSEFDVKVPAQMFHAGCNAYMEISKTVDVHALDSAVRAMLAHPDFRAQLRAYVAEQMRGLVPGVEKPVTHGGTEECKADAFNDCRAETLANIAKWESSNGQ